MPTGPRGQKRPADVVGCAVMVAKIATGEIAEELEPEPEHSQARRKAGEKGGNARAEALTTERRAEIAQQAASARWKQLETDAA